ncbi:hypothetical protein CCACVL1_26694 [Corchorus capsularis]|uniref:Sulfotransferase n=1 Tax=Corchorus capsularis TaxID=210143 RepID=A0A1R3GDN5_COCAP|nr:hypothetical protein CCACVL1_26694 [Corchorus capsularis]
MEERQEIIDEGYQKTYKKLEEMLETLPKGGDQTLGHGLFLYKGFWLPDIHIKGNMLIHDHFKPRPTDIVLSSFPKCGTTWLKALCFAIINRNSYNFDKNHPLLTSNPHDLTGLGFERLIQEGGSTSLVETLPSPRLLPTHLAFSLFPDSMASGSGACRFVYICRNPKDAFVSLWHFFNKLRRLKQVPQLSLEDAFDSFSKGVSFLGPFWDHVLGYWKASLESPNKVLFLKYEDMMREPSVYVRKLAEFLDLPFSEDEENEGIVEKIVNLCSFENLSNLDVNKNNNIIKAGLVNTSSFFRKGQVGDWINHLSPEMVKVLDQITQESFQASSLELLLVAVFPTLSQGHDRLGGSSSGKILNTQIHRWPETVLEKLDLVFLDAPIPAEENPVLQEQGFDPPFYNWFQSNEDMSEFTYFEECVAYLEDYMIKNGPFDGFLGFSEGAILSASLPGMQRDGLALTKVPKIKFVILIAGAKFGGIKLGLPKLASTAFSVPLELPSLHIIGDLDRIKPQSIELMEAFVDPFVIYHPEGHTIPKLDEKSLEVMFAFIERIQETIRTDEARIILNEKSKL